MDLIKREMFKKQLVGYNTRTFYAQQKYNLLREENEGFAKLLIELNQENIDASNAQVVKDNIQKLIGYF